MAAEETKIAHDIILKAAKQGVVLFKNVRGVFYTKDGVIKIIACVKKGDLRGALLQVKMLRQVSAGLQAAGASDLIGFVPVLVTPDMVGKKIAVYCALEVKTDTGTASPEQKKFIDFVVAHGGKAGIARSYEQALEVIER